MILTQKEEHCTRKKRFYGINQKEYYKILEICEINGLLCIQICLNKAHKLQGEINNQIC